MVNDSAASTDATGPRTRVSALLPDAGSVRCAVRVDGALRSTVGWHSDIGVRAGADWGVANRLAHRVRTAGGWRARVSWVLVFWLEHCE